MKWKQLPQSGDVPLARSSHTVAAVGGKLYLWGGEHKPREPIDSQLYVYDMETGAWTQPETTGVPPSARNAATAAAMGNRIYFFGGRTGIEMGEGSLGDLYCYDTVAREWTAVEPQGGVMPPKRSYHAMAVQGTCLYVFGGCGESGRLADLWEFDTATNTWRQLPTSDAIKGRGGAGFAATPDGSLWVVGGFTGQEMDDVHRFDLASGSWDCPKCCAGAAAGQEGGAAAGEGSAEGGGGGSGGAGAGCGLPARSVFALATHGCHSCSHGNHIVVFGGEVDPTDLGHAAAGQFSNDLFCFDAKQAVEGWHKLTPEGETPCPRGWLAAAATPSGILISGGNSNSNERLGDLWLLDMHG